MDLEEARAGIRAVDTEMARLFEKRMELAKAVAAYKKERGLPIEDKAQEARMIEELGAGIGNEALRPFYVRFLTGTIEVSKLWQRLLTEGEQAKRGAEEAAAQDALRKESERG